MPTDLQQSYPLILALAAAVAAGLVGSFALMKRMALAGDVISHIALPGLGLAFLLGVNPLVGGAATLFLGTLIVWHLQKHTTLATETAIGVMFAASVALGTIITPEADLIDALFGGFGKLTTTGFLVGILATVVVIAFIIKFRDRLIIELFSPELAAASGVNVARTDLWFLLIFALTVLLGLQFLGALLMGALIIIPAATGRQLAKTLPAFLVISSLASVLSVAAGFALSARYDLPLGPTIVISAAALFIVSLIKKSKA